MKKITTLTLTLLLIASLAGCSKKDKDEDLDDKDLVENYTFTEKVTIDFGNDGAPTISNSLEGSGVAVTTDGANVTVVSTTDENVEYTLTGTTSSGSLKIYSDKKFKLTLSGINMTSVNQPAINIQSSKRAYVVLSEGTSNSLTDSGEYDTDRDQNSDGEDRKGTLFSEGQLIISGNGSLKVNAFVKHAIATDEYLRIRQGNISIYADNADGIHVKEYLWVENGTISIEAKSDGIQCTKGYITIDAGTLQINSQDDCIRTTYGQDPNNDTDSTIVTDITIRGGSIQVASSKLKDSAFGIYSTQRVLIGGGQIRASVYNQSHALFGEAGVSNLDNYDWTAHYVYTKP